MPESVSLPSLVPSGTATSSRLARRLKNELYSGTATRSATCTVPQLVIPEIASEDPMSALRIQRVSDQLAAEERKLRKINRNSVGMGRRAISVDVLANAVGNTTEMLPKQQTVFGGKPFICRELKQNEIPTMAGDALFTSTSRADYFWKTKKARSRDKKHKRPYDDFYKFRDSFLMQKSCLRS
ncbi:unnamed protein product [Amoebophrya sp. A25]|nr:unnamed protein product [Amoebophrya sp. A25]|eukprot:GSA25T00003574001.1